MNKFKIFIIKFSNDNDLYFFNKEIKHFNKAVCNYYELNSGYIGIIYLPIKLEKIIPHIKEFGALKRVNKIDIAYIKEYGKLIKI